MAAIASQSPSATEPARARPAVSGSFQRREKRVDRVHDWQCCQIEFSTVRVSDRLSRNVKKPRINNKLRYGATCGGGPRVKSAFSAAANLTALPDAAAS